jgi:hypothetical protein
MRRHHHRPVKVLSCCHRCNLLLILNIDSYEMFLFLIIFPMNNKKTKKQNNTTQKSNIWAYPWSIVTQIFHNSQPNHGDDHTTFEVMTSTSLRGTLDWVASLLAGTLYQGNPDMNHKLWNIVSTEIYTLYGCGAGMLLG